jgi:hypothetical protein
LGRLKSSDEELASTLVNIEAALNLRPITPNTEDALTPAHFLCARKLDSVTFWNRKANGEKSNEGTPKDTKYGRRLLETLGKGIPPRVKKPP